MKSFKPNRFLILFSLVCLTGCGSTRDADFVRASNDSNIKKAASCYQLFASRSAYTGPKSLQELKDFLKNNQSIQKNLPLIGIEPEKLDDYFISENDGKEFDFRWKIFIDPDRTKEPLVFEKEGKDGIRLVMLSNRKILEVDNDKKYQDLLNGKVSRDEAKTDLEKEEEAAAN